MSIEKVTTNLIAAFGADAKCLEQVLDLFPLGVIMTNRKGCITYYNQAQGKIDNLDPAEVEGKVEIEVLAPITGPNIMKVCQDTGQPILGYIFPYRTPKGGVVNAAYWVFPILECTEVTGAICFTQPLLGEFSQNRPPASTQPIQWPGTVPINMPVKNVVGTNKAFQKSLHMIKMNANNPFPILIAGETGSGKEMLVKLTHQASSRRNNAYLAVNCSAIPGSLLEGLLFGTVKGGFTGALDRAGFFESANGGTLYLDEIDSMPMDCQPKLLRAIQEMHITRVGSSKEIKLDVKLLSSISTSPYKAISAGTLRADLFYRLAVVVVPVPPLRERLDDLELLADHFICKYNNLLGKSALKIDGELLGFMRGYSWPGNVRELEHMLTGALAVVQNEHIIKMEHIPEHYLQAFLDNTLNNTLNNTASNTASNTLSNTNEEDQGKFNKYAQSATQPHRATSSGLLDRMQQEELALKKCLTQTRGNVCQSAELMGISRQLFAYRMLKYGLTRHDFK